MLDLIDPFLVPGIAIPSIQEGGPVIAPGIYRIKLSSQYEAPELHLELGYEGEGRYNLRGCRFNFGSYRFSGEQGVKFEYPTTLGHHRCNSDFDDLFNNVLGKIHSVRH